MSRSRVTDSYCTFSRAPGTRGERVKELHFPGGAAGRAERACRRTECATRRRVVISMEPAWRQQGRGRGRGQTRGQTPGDLLPGRSQREEDGVRVGRGGGGGRGGSAVTTLPKAEPPPSNVVSSQSRFDEIRKSNQAAAQRLVEKPCSFSSDDDDEEEEDDDDDDDVEDGRLGKRGTILQSTLTAYTNQMGGDVSDLERTRQYLNEAFQSGAITCLICIASVKRTQAVWSCVGCYCIFHIPCIQKWAKDSIFLVSSVTDEDFGKKEHPWPCPKCRYEYSPQQTPCRYYCYCGKEVDPRPRPLAPPTFLWTECLPGRNLFGLVILFLSAVCGGKLMGMIRLPTLPPFPPLLGMLLMGLILRNVPYVTDAVYIDQKWSSSLRSVALAIILTRAGLGLNPAALKRLKAVCVRVAVGPCTTEACTVAVVSHFLMGLPWIWGFILGFVLAAVSPAVVVPSMLLLQQAGFGVQKGIPTLLMAAGSFDDVLAITGFTTCLGMAFGTGSTWLSLGKGVLEVVVGIFAGAVLGVLLHLFPSDDQADLVLRRSCMLLGLSVFSVFASHSAGLGGAGGLCTLVLSFIAGLSWDSNKAPVAAVVGRFWDVFQPLLFGLIGAEITISTLNPNTVGLGMATLCVGVVVRVLVTFAVVLFAVLT
ncbi:hypothetical protein AOLI_G00153000 [Acnodon oligacanthus]